MTTDYFDDLQNLERWLHTLPPTDQVVASFVFRRTRAWRKREELIPNRHFLDGVYDRDGVLVCPSTNLSPVTLRASLARLQESGLLTLRVTGTHNRLACHYSLNLELPPMPLPTPKRLRQQESPLDSSKHFGSEKLTPAGGEELTPKTGVWGTELTPRINNKGGKLQSKPVKAAGAATTSRAATFEQARQKAVEIKARAKTRHKSAIDNPALPVKALERFWHTEAFDRFQTKAFPFSVALRSALHKKQTQFRDHGHVETFTSFVCWVMDNWAGIITLEFSWMTNGRPALDSPDPWFLVKQFHVFHLLYLARVNSEWVTATSGHAKAGELAVLMAAGQTYEEATILIAKRKQDEQASRRVATLAIEVARLEARLARLDSGERQSQIASARKALREMNNRVEE